MSFITNFMKNVKVSRYKEMNPVKSFKKVVETLLEASQSTVIYPQMPDYPTLHYAVHIKYV